MSFNNLKKVVYLSTDELDNLLDSADSQYRYFWENHKATPLTEKGTT